MNIVLDSLYLRKPRIEYVSPPICPITPSSASASGFSMILADICPPTVTPLSLGPNNILVWEPLQGACGGGCANNLPGGSAQCKSVEICFSVYRSALNAPNGVYDLVQACLPRLTAVMCTPGCYQARAVNAEGIEFFSGQPVCGDGSSPILISAPNVPGAVAFNLYREPDPNNPAGNYQLVIAMYGGEAYEPCATGCYKIGFITPDGATPLSNTQCVNVLCPPQVCPVGQIWNPATCACVPNICPAQPCTPGFIWDFSVCECVMCPEQPCQPNQVWDTTTCSCIPCPPQPCNPGFHWDTNTCSCQPNVGPNWGVATIDPTWLIREGSFTGPATGGVDGGFVNNSANFNGDIWLSTPFTFDYDIAQASAFVFGYTGPAVTTQLTMVINLQAAQPFAIQIRQDGVYIAATTGFGAPITLPQANGTYIIDLPISAGVNSSIRVDVQGGVGPGTTGSHMNSLSLNFVNL